MVTAEFVVAGVMLVALMVYLLSGGADFGGGIWDLFARGPRARRQRETIAHAIGPIWEANHVWLILVIVLLFVCFPKGFAAISIALHVPLTLMLLGIVLRGSAFVFRAYDVASDEAYQRWSRVFAMASVVSPLMLGVSVGAVVSVDIRVDPASGQVTTDFVSSWFAPFPFALGLFNLALCAFLAAVYLTVETEGDPALQEDFRTRALGAAVAVGVMAWVSFALARGDAPRIGVGLSGRDWSLPFQAVTGLVAIGAIVALWFRRFRWARALAIGQAMLIVLGWGLSQYPYLIVPDLTFRDAAAPESVLWSVLTALAAGSILLVPAFWYLYAVFKGARHEAEVR